MPPQPVEIGPITFTAAQFDIVKIAVTILLTAIVTYLATSAIDRRKRRHERDANLREDSRKAITHALQWMDPMRSAMMKAGSLTARMRSGSMDEDAFEQAFPDLLKELGKLEVPTELRDFLPKDAYIRGITLVKELEDIYYLNLEGRSAEASAFAAKLEIKQRELEDYLRKSLRDTY